jgi:hypothetical protein
MKISCGHRVFQGPSFHMICSIPLRRIIVSTGVGVCFLAAVLASGQNIPSHPVSVSEGSAKPPAIVIGFLGGFIARNNPVHSEVQLAARLRQEYPSEVEVATFENHHGQNAQREILKLLDTNHDGTLTVKEKQNARIIIYGHSWGASESIYLARWLEKNGIPVLLTLQVDSIPRSGSNDTTIPANVAQAANFYQSNGFLHGHHDIRAADAARTRIIGNFRFDYETSPLKCTGYPWYDQIFMKPHIQIECDPAVWNQVEFLIRANLPPEARSQAAQ